MWFLYRTNSGELQAISVNQFDLPLSPIYSQVENPTVTATDGPRIYDGSEVRTATAGELAGFPAFRLEDDKTKSRASANNQLIIVDSEIGLLIRALALVVMDEINRHSLKINEILDAIDSGANFAQIKTAIAAITDSSTRTGSQLKNAIKNKIDTLQAD